MINGFIIFYTGQIFIAVEYCAKGSLEKFLKNCRPSFINLVCGDTICITTSFRYYVMNVNQPTNFNRKDYSTKITKSFCCLLTLVVKTDRTIRMKILSNPASYLQLIY